MKANVSVRLILLIIDIEMFDKRLMQFDINKVEGQLFIQE